MQQEEVFNLVPENISGKPVSLQEERIDGNATIAAVTFKRAAKRLLNLPIWEELSGAASAGFELFDSNGGEVDRLAMAGDLMRIDIPGPGTVSGKGYDWVKIEKLVDGSNPNEWTEHFVLQVRPCPSPFDNGKDVSHFFTGHATSTFILNRKGATTTAYYYGRNEEMNKNVDNIADKIRNTMVALGSFAGLSEIQWGALLKGLLEDEIGG